MPVAKMAVKYIDGLCLQDPTVLRKDREWLLPKKERNKKKEREGGMKGGRKEERKRKERIAEIIISSFKSGRSFGS